MRILYFYQYYSTPKGAWGTRVHEFARRWVAEGHEVTVITSIYDKSDLAANRLVEDQWYDGVKVKVLNVIISNKQSLGKRLFTFVQYSILSIWFALTIPTDIVIASSGPITVGIPGLIARYLRGKKLVFEVRDLWPEGIIQLGILKNSIAQKLAYWFEKQCYKASSLIVALSPGMADWIKEKQEIVPVISVPNACDNDLFGVPAMHTLPDWATTFHFSLYTGNIGKVNNSELLLKTALLLDQKQINDIHIVLIGDGQQKEEIKSKAQKLNLLNIHMLDLMPKTQLVCWVQNALACIVPLKSTPILDTSSPNKLFDSLAAGVPVIQTTQGWIKNLLTQEKCGYTIEADDAEGLAEHLITLRDNPILRAEMGENAKKLSEEVFDRDILAQKMLEAIEHVYEGTFAVSPHRR